jgi:hypothetical protein
MDPPGRVNVLYFQNKPYTWKAPNVDVWLNGGTLIKLRPE